MMTMEPATVESIRDTAIRPYKEIDLDGIINVYKSAFAEFPWNEYMKCDACGERYSKDALIVSVDDCVGCERPLSLRPFWTAKDIIGDLRYAQSRPDPLVLVASSECRVDGFVWGYRVDLETMDWLRGVVAPETNYMDDIAVRGSARRRGIGKGLGAEYLRQTDVAGIPVVLRTDVANAASMALFRRLGFMPLHRSDGDWFYDPKEESRVYLLREIGAPMMLGRDCDIGDLR